LTLKDTHYGRLAPVAERIEFRIEGLGRSAAN
jgi:hypothetical protein